MRRLAILLALMSATTLLAAGVAFTQAPEEDADPYIVVLKDSVDEPSRVAEGIEQRQDVDVGFIYSNALEGFSAEIPDDSVDEVRNNPQVDFVERDKIVHATVQTLPWGVDRIQADKSSTRAGDHKGAVSSVNVYVIDTGIDGTHADLRVVDQINFSDAPDTDCNGHGTHIAGTLAARDNTTDVVGVAPGAPLTSVKVLDCEGHGRASEVIKGIAWVTKEVKGPDGVAGTDDDKRPAIANLSLSGPATRSLDRAVKRSARNGVFYSVAAGNQGRDACKRSPARAGAGKGNGIVTTAAVNDKGAEPRWSNYGPCVDLWAPGTHILSTWLRGGTKTGSGTSVAAPHVGGTAALYLSRHPGAAPATVEKKLKTDSKPSRRHESQDGRRIRRVYAGGY